MKTSRSFQAILFFCIVVIISGYVGYFLGTHKVSTEWKQYNPHISVTGKEPPVGLGHVDFSMFWNVWQRLEDSYYDKKVLDTQKMLNGAISGMVSGLDDPYTMYLPPNQNTDFKQGLLGQFQGIGAELGMKDKQIVVVAPLTGSPAEKAGIKTGDAVFKVDNQSTAGWTLAQAVDKIRGPKGSLVGLLIGHKYSNSPQEIKILRDTITVKSVDGWVKKLKDIDSIKGSKPATLKPDSSVLYIRLSQFGDNTNQEWLSLINNLSLASKKEKDIKGAILDLRNNPGGYLTDATFVASEFLTDGVVVIEDKGNGDKTESRVNRKGILTDIPLVVLINKGSASASEIVAGALRDHNRALLVGDTSFGKGTVQEAQDLGNGAGIHITIAKWLTPNETWVHGKGLTPDVSISLDSNDPAHDAQLEKAVEYLLR